MQTHKLGGSNVRQLDHKSAHTDARSLKIDGDM